MRDNRHPRLKWQARDSARRPHSSAIALRRGGGGQPGAHAQTARIGTLREWARTRASADNQQSRWQGRNWETRNPRSRGCHLTGAARKMNTKNPLVMERLFEVGEGRSIVSTNRRRWDSGAIGGTDAFYAPKSIIRGTTPAPPPSRNGLFRTQPVRKPPANIRQSILGQ